MTQHFLFSSLFQLLSLSSLIFVTGCLAPQKQQSEGLQLKLNTQVADFISHGDWLGLNLELPPVSHLREQLETIEINKNQLKQNLKTRGEAHITVLSPPEFAFFNGKFPMVEIEALVKPFLKTAQWQNLCIGQGHLAQKPEVKTYFVVIKSQDLLALRRLIKSESEKRGLISPFNPEEFLPHITLGFTERDLHFQDGVKKDLSSCQYPLQN